jgi:hypothetical protein
MQKISTMRTSGKNVFKGQLTIGLDLGDHSSSYCVLDEAGEILLEQKVSTTPEAMKQTFGRMQRSRIAMEKLDRRVQVTATKSWPKLLSNRGRRRALIR